MTHHPTRTWTCTTCRGEIRHRPTIHVGLVFCCAGCVAGGPCICSYDGEDMPAEATPQRASVLELAVVN
jgi:hypothetical protein